MSREAPPALEVTGGWYGRPFHGEPRSGDLALVAEPTPSVLRAVIIDIAGHGPRAASAAERLRAAPWLATIADLMELAKRLDEELRGELGAALAIADVDRARAELRCLAIGSVHARVYGVSPATIESQAGMVGEHMPTCRPRTLAIHGGDVVILASDGVRTRGLRALEPSLLLAPPERTARRIVEDHGRAHDDATCVVLTVFR